MKKLYLVTLLAISSSLLPSSNFDLDSFNIDMFYDAQENEEFYNMLKAIESENYDKVQNMLKSGFIPDTIVNNLTALMSAINHDNDKIARLLLTYEANPNLANQDGITPLFLAAHSSNPLIIPLLLQFDARLENEDDETQDIINQVLQTGASPKTITHASSNQSIIGINTNKKSRK